MLPGLKYFATVVFLTLCAHTVFGQPPEVRILKEELLFPTGRHFAQCHASTIEESQTGELLTSWFAGPYEGSKDVAIWGSVYDGDGWSVPTVWADGKINDSLQYPCWNPVLVQTARRGDHLSLL